jgi:hypothetical protein
MGTFQNTPIDEFQISGKEFHLPTETFYLEPKLKREITICNLFVNHNMTAADIIRILDENYENVVLSLIRHQVVLDRRQHLASSPSQIERRRSAARGW